MKTKKANTTSAKKTGVSSRPKGMTGKKAKRVLARAEGSQCFWVNEGPILADLVEFAHALSDMSRETYTYHVTDGRNDFADWIEFVLGDTELASVLRSATKPSAARTFVVRRLKIYDLS